MSELKLANNQYIDVQQLDRLVKFIKEEGFVRLIVSALNDGITGVLDAPSDVDYDFLRVDMISGVVSVKAGIGVDQNGNWIEVLADITSGIFTHPGDSTTKYVVIRYLTQAIEKGTVTIAANGDITGVGTFFTEYLRVQGNVPLKVRFPNSVGNNGEYEIISVADDTNAVISGTTTLVPEAGEEIVVVGAFTPGKFIAPADKDIYELDFFEFEVYDLLGSVTADDILLAAITFDGVTDLVLDRRRENRLPILASLLDSEYIEGQFNGSSIIAGVEQIVSMEDSGNMSRIRLGWGFTAGTTWSNPDIKTLVMSGGAGGIYDDVTDINANDFNGWYAYILGTGGQIVFKAKVKDTVVDGGNRNLEIRNNAIEVIATGNELIVVPDCDTIDFRITEQGNPTFGEVNIIKTYDITNRAAYIDVPIPDSKNVFIEYRLSKGKFSGDWRQLQSGDYFAEDQFSYPEADLTGAVLTVYTGGNITLMTKTRSRPIDNSIAITLVSGWAETSVSTVGGVRFHFDPLTGECSMFGHLDGTASASNAVGSIPIEFVPEFNIVFPMPVGIVAGVVRQFLTLNSALGTFSWSGLPVNRADIWSLAGVRWFVEKDQFDVI